MIDISTLFSVPRIEESIQSTRQKLQISKPAVVNKYNNKLDSLYTEHCIYERLNTLVKKITRAKPHDLPKLIIKFNALNVEKLGYTTAAHTQYN